MKPGSATSGSMVGFQFVTVGNEFTDSSISDFGFLVDSQEPCGYLDLTVNGQQFPMPGGRDPHCSEVQNNYCSDGVNFSGQPNDSFYAVFDDPGTYSCRFNL
jgi:hypothetical protein